MAKSIKQLTAIQVEWVKPKKVQLIYGAIVDGLF